MVVSSVFLVGMPASGKSTVGKALAKRLGIRFVDSDEEIVARTGVSIATIFEVEGEAGFRDREAKTIAQLVEAPAILLATGGGAVLRAETRHALRAHGTVIYLRASIEELVKRTRHDRRRPLLAGGDAEVKLRELHAIRDPLYREVAHLIVESGVRSAQRLAESIAHRLDDSGKMTTNEPTEPADPA